MAIEPTQMKPIKHLCYFLLANFLAACSGPDLTADQIQAIHYEFGGGELGAPFTSVEINRDGTVHYHRVEGTSANRSDKTEEMQLEPESVTALFERLAEMNIGQLADYEPQCCDIDITRVTVVTSQGSESYLYQGVGKRDTHWEEINKTLHDFIADLRKP